MNKTRETLWTIVAALLGLLGLILTADLQGQSLVNGPDLRIIVGDEGYPDLPGLIGLAPHGSDPRCMTIWSYAPYRPLAFNLQVVNIGDRDWSPFTRPELVYYDAWTGTMSVSGLFRFTLLDTNGATLARATRDARFIAWDALSLLPKLPRNHGWFSPGISPGRVAIAAEPLTAGTWLDITGVPDGDFVLRVELDPFNAFGQRTSVDVGLSIHAFQITFRQ